MLAGPDGTVHRYRKIHPFSFARRGAARARRHRLVTVDVEGFRVSLFVCYDLRFADEFWQLAHDTDVYLVPANWPAKRRAALDDAAAGPGDREPGVRRRASTGSATGGGLDVLRRQPRSSTRSARLLATGGRTESILLADIDTDTSQRPATTSASSTTAADHRPVTQINVCVAISAALPSQI